MVIQPAPMPYICRGLCKQVYLLVRKVPFEGFSNFARQSEIHTKCSVVFSILWWKG